MSVETHMERQAKGQQSQSSVQDELLGAKTHDDGHTPCSNQRPHGARSIQCTGQRHVQKPEVGHGFGKDPSMPYLHSRMSTQDAESDEFGGKRPTMLTSNSRR